MSLAARLGATGVAAVGLDASDASITRYDVKLLGDADLSRSWYIYQLCVLNTTGGLPTENYRQLVADVMVREAAAPVAPAASPAPSVPPGGVSAPPTATAAPVIMVAGAAAFGAPAIDSEASAPAPLPGIGPAAPSGGAATASAPSTPMAALTAAAAGPAVRSGLDGPDGAAVELSDPENWKVFAVGSATAFGSDSASLQEAIAEATLAAKAALARFFSERLTSTSSVETITNTAVRQAGGDPVVQRDVVKRQMSAMTSSADAIIRGVVTLDARVDPATGEVRVKVGQSQKTLGVADRMRSLGGAAPSTPPAAPPTTSPTTDF